MTKKISRRDVLKLGALGTLGSLVAACAPATATATRASATLTRVPPTIEPTSAPAVNATNAPAALATPMPTTAPVNDVTTLIGEVTNAAKRYLDSLNAAQRTKSSYAFTNAELTRWHWTTPSGFPRNGLPLREMQANQRNAALALLQTSLSASGLQTAFNIIALQKDLGNDPELYYVTVFGTPGVEPWGWRWEGHHLSRRFNVIKGKVSVTPFFLGSWPTVNNAGLKAMEREEWAARELVTSLDTTQRATAIFQARTLGQHVTQNQDYVSPLEPVGLAATNFNADQQKLLMEIVQKYLGTLPAAIATTHLARLQAADIKNIRFGWAGALESQKTHYYRLQGPTFLLEHDNSRNGGTHIHSVWRDFAEDFGKNF